MSRRRELSPPVAPGTDVGAPLLVPFAEKKKPKKKKKAATTGMTSAQAAELQSEPPRIPVSTFFKNSVYPIGEIQEYKDE